MKTLVDLMTAKAIQSDRDLRMATFIDIDEDDVTLDMQGIGKRVFPLDMVLRGFTMHLDYESLVTGFLKQNHVDSRTPRTKDDAWKLSCSVFDIMVNRFKDITNVECYKAVENYLNVQ